LGKKQYYPREGNNKSSEPGTTKIMTPSFRIILVCILGLAPLLLIPQLSQTFQPPLGVLLCLIGLVALLSVARLERAWRWDQLILNIFAVTGILSLFITHLPVGTWLGRPLMVPPAQENAQAIVVLASGATYHGNPPFSGFQRLLHGIRLLRDNRAPLLVVSTGDQVFDIHHESAWVASLTQLTKVPPEKLEILKDGITTTYTEARRVSTWLREKGISSILLVTNGPHILRASLCFDREGISVRPAPVQTSETLIEYRDHAMGTFDSTMHEWIGLGLYWLRGQISFPFPKKSFSP